VHAVALEDRLLAVQWQMFGEGAHRNLRQQASTGIRRLCASIRCVVKASSTTEKNVEIVDLGRPFLRERDG